ncbi:hypothetical protein [Kribbella albertanoniae]|uniref:DUF1036 domain-containing protein n=1 Tax=Kribbella albertanoniae TaxID=1266829 RepID=A0A4R4PLA2_9ACTN|nr:hypothetical protein [Kribbella albertanoniae]TDC22897.1 hypothetical protein E1261_29765 [Kribbella albertanoniae]
MRRLLAAAVALGVLTTQLTSAVPATAAPGGRDCKTVSGTANLLVGKVPKRVGTYTHTVHFCWGWGANPADYWMLSAKRSTSWKVMADDKTCSMDFFAQWDGDPRKGHDQFKRVSTKMWESSMGYDFKRNYFRTIYDDDYDCDFRYQGQLVWRPRVIIQLKPKPHVRAEPVFPNE